MTWVKLDDRFAEHTKIRKAGVAGGWLMVNALCFCARNLTDGFIDAQSALILAPIPDIADVIARLVKIGLWERVEGGYQVHDYLDYQPTKARVLADRAAALSRQKSHRDKRRDKSVSHGVTNVNVTPFVTPPVTAFVTPTPVVSLDLEVQEQEIDQELQPSSSELRPDVEMLCQLLAELIEKNGSKRPRIGKTWRDSCRRLIDLDSKTPEQAEAAIRWSQADEFWRGVILSMPNLRKNYERLRLAASRDATPGKHKPYTNPASPDAYTEAL